MYNALIIDGNNLFWRSTPNALQDSIIIEGLKIHSYIIVDFLKKLNWIIENYCYNNSEIYILFDNPESKINLRKQISEGAYKHSREKKKENNYLYFTLNIIIEILKNYNDNFNVVIKNSDENNEYIGYEADDLALPIKNYILKKNEKNTLLFVSADLDWARNIADNCVWYNYQYLFDKKMFIKRYGFSPESNSLQMWKTLKGDNSDNIKNYLPRFPDEFVIPIVKKYNHIKDFLENLYKEELPDHWKTKIKEHSRDLLINFQLVDFLELEDDIENYIFKCFRKIKVLQLWYKALNIPFENFMVTKEVAKNNFFEEKKLRRCK